MVAEPPPPAPPIPLPPPAPLPPRGNPGLRLAGQMVVIVGGLMLCFVVQFAALGTLKHGRDQNRAHEELRVLLANATAPVSAVDEGGRLLDSGTPLGILEIPRLGVREVIGEGTSARALKSGPGHLRDTPMPGQAGGSVILGRRAGYGGPFAQLDKLTPGDVVKVTTGQGEHTFRVQGTRRAGDPQRHVPQAGKGGLTLATADGSYFLPTDVLWVDAKLTSDVQPNSGALPKFAVPDNEQVMAGDQEALVPVALWALVLAAGAIAVVFLHVRVGRWQAWVVGVPLLGALGITLADQAAALLPNLI
ncbi:class E sortase [Actinosynnema sp. NPDC047251]|uniref:Peptidase C60, sortase A and B n=1 Tax=Saccharothrix espanaensis (strain ATCC 51144 / DSM 44229 / JCM 9112 / NBRC 15066 / NRRL 15764) TaxID=1179773 RepID=K0JW71_SACES|nr:class E sortase [Saccharothrix espanaensis]CCH28438.1 Peptidase C60, sortase A and B [Saccharothrix espanaensis DSM 44229]